MDDERQACFTGPHPAGDQRSATWLIRVPEVFEELTGYVSQNLAAASSKKLGQEYHLIRTANPAAVRESDAAIFLRWNLPIQLNWPCSPQKTEDFVEKAAQKLLRKFGNLAPQCVLIGQLDPNPSHNFYRNLAVQLRARALELFPPTPVSPQNVESQDSEAQTLFCLLGKEGLFAGMQSPKACGGFYPGGTKFISQNSPGTISRAGAKIAEALHFLRLYRAPLAQHTHWLELGASPGGMTSELLARGHSVTAVDRAPLDKRLDHERQLTFIRSDVATFRPAAGMKFDALLCDLNGHGHESIAHVIRLSANLKKKAPVIFTLKLPGVETAPEIIAQSKLVITYAAGASLKLLAQTHLSYNRNEFTLVFENSV